ncbi:hypothetical protein MTP99_002462 [Tenebrio molitor]|nr:hypothetical protein MTP99_002462 [Tenebrio molitor]
MWTFSEATFLNMQVQWEHLYIFTPGMGAVWVFSTCTRRLPFWLNRAEQRVQWKGLAPVCLVKWIWRVPFWLKPLLQCSHWKIILSLDHSEMSAIAYNVWPLPTVYPKVSF